MALRFAVLAFVLLATTVLPSVSQQPAYPIEARLATSLDAHTLAVGQEILFTSTQSWKDGDCRLAQGAAIHGKVAAVQFGKGVKHENIAIAFTYPCVEQGTFPIHWIALLAADQDLMKGIRDNPGNVQALRSESFGEGINAKSTSSQGVSDPSGRGTPSVPLFSDDGAQPDPVIKRPTQIHSGDVWQIPRTKLQVANGPEQSSIVSATSGHLRLVAGTVFVLSVGKAVQIARATQPETAPAPVLTTAQRLEKKIPKLVRCESPDCTLSNKYVAGAAPEVEWRLPLARMGYRTLKKREMVGLNYDPAIAFVGTDQLLVVFDSRALVKRSAQDRPEDRPRMLRAVLFDLNSRAAVKTLNWRVGDDRRVLWQLPNGHVVLRDGNILHWYGPGLAEERQLSFDGSFAFFRASPDGKHLAIGTYRELHTPTEHARLAAANANGPEERIDVRLLDGDLHEIQHGQQSSRAYAPTLLDHGMIELRNFAGTQFYLRERGWDGAALHSFARISSACIPHVGGILTDMVVLETCPSGGMEHRVTVLREDGRPVLETSTRLEDFAPISSANSGSATFALAVLGGGDLYQRGASFEPKDLGDETITVYRAGDGRMILAVKLVHPLPAQQPVALSTDGAIAVLDGEDIRVFGMHTAVKLADRETNVTRPAGNN